MLLSIENADIAAFRHLIILNPLLLRHRRQLLLLLLLLLEQISGWSRCLQQIAIGVVAHGGYAIFSSITAVDNNLMRVFLLGQ